MRGVPWREGEGGVGERLVGGQGTIATPKPIKTVGSYWPYAPTLFDYIRRAMPQNAPQSLSNEDVYAVSAYILNMNGLLPAGRDARRQNVERDQDAEPRRCSPAIPGPTSRIRPAKKAAERDCRPREKWRSGR